MPTVPLQLVRRFLHLAFITVLCAALPTSPIAVAAEPADSARHDALLDRIESAYRQGAFDDGLAEADHALTLATKLADPTRVAATRSLRAQLLAGLGRTHEARAEFERALSESRDLPSLRDTTLLNLGNLDATTGRLEEATRAYRTVFERASERGDTALAARAAANAIRAEVDRDATSFEAAQVDPVVALLGRIESRSLRAELSIHLARSVERARERGAGPRPTLVLLSNELLRRALEFARGPGSARIRAEALGRLGALYASEGHVVEALQLTLRALAQARESGLVVPLYRWQAQAGDLLAEQGRRDQAIEHYAAAIALLGPNRDQVSGSGTYATRRLSFEREITRTYRRQVDLLLLRARAREGVDERSTDLRQALAVLESYKVAELRDYFADDCVDRARESRTSVERAAPDAALIYPIVLDDRIEILVSKGNRIESHRTEISRADFEAEVTRFRSFLETRTTRQYLRPARRLYDWIVRPIEGLLGELDPRTLVFVPDGVLHTVPMAALHDGEQFLIERYALGITPSLELTDPRPLDREGITALYAGLTEGVQGFVPLPQVADELANARRLVPGELMIDAAFSREAIIDRLSQKSFDLIHIASHAEFESASGGGFLLTYDGRLNLDELRNAVGQLQYRAKPLELLILSACQTAVGDQRAALGLSGVAVNAGARSVLGSLWTVQDEATAILISTFYEALTDADVSRAEALRRAQRNLLEQRAFRHPLYWAGFLMINSWL
jgi:CHAT domain-containing protein/predicted negative regulator of RcsB-dependent stress response